MLLLLLLSKGNSLNEDNWSSKSIKCYVLVFILSFELKATNTIYDEDKEAARANVDGHVFRRMHLSVHFSWFQHGSGQYLN